MSPNAIDAAFVGVFIVGIVLWVAWRHGRRVASLRDALRDAGARDAHVVGWSAACGTIDGAHFELVLDAVERAAPEPRTTARAPMPVGAPPCEIDLHPPDPQDARLVADGLEVDVGTGDAAFDSKLVVEAAPVDVFRAVFDAQMRRDVLALMPCSLLVGGGALRLERIGGPVGREDAARMIRALSRIRDRLGSTASELDARRRETLARDGVVEYRDVPAGAVEAARRARDAQATRELDVLRATRARRAGPVQLTVGGLVLVFVIASAILVFLLSGAKC